MGSMAMVLGRAEDRLADGVERYTAITLALQDHPMPPAVAEACRGAWQAMTSATVRETLRRHGYLERLCAQMQRDLSKPHQRALNDALDWSDDCGCGAEMRRMLDAHHEYEIAINRAMNETIPMGLLVTGLLVLVVG